MPLFKSQEKIPTPFQRKTCWLALTGISGTIVVALVIAFFWLVAIILGYLQQVILPIAIAGIIAYILGPVVSWLERRKINRTLSVTMVLIAFLGIVTSILLYVIPNVVNKTDEIIKNRDKYYTVLTETFDHALQHPIGEKIIDHYYTSSLDNLHASTEENESSFLSEIVAKLTRSHYQEEDKKEVLPREDKDNLLLHNAPINSAVTPSSSETSTINTTHTPQTNTPIPGLKTREKLFIALENNSATYAKILWNWLYSGRELISGGIAWIIGGVLVPIFVFFFLKESAVIAERWTDLLPLRASKFKQEVVETLTEINGYLIAFFRGQMIVSLIDGCLIGICLAILGMDIPFAIAIGAAVGILGIIPYVGILSVFLPTLLLSWGIWHDWYHLLWVTLIFLGCNQFDSWVIQPKIVGNAVGLHEITVIFSVIFWSFVFGGVVGALLAVPLTASVKVIFQRYVWMNLKAPRKITPARPSCPV